MAEGLKSFWLCFVPLFVAVHAIGVLPMFMALTEGLDVPGIRRVIYQSVITATIVGLSFLAVGRAVLVLLGITVADFMIAGGSPLFVISILAINIVLAGVVFRSAGTIRARAKITYHFGISASGHLRPILIRKIREIACYSCGFVQSDRTNLTQI